MDRTVPFSYMDQEGDYIEEEFKAVWAICSYCEGEGHHSRHLGAITESDRQDWSEEEIASYFAGHYDMECEVCKGKGKVLEMDLTALDPEIKPLILKQIKRNERDARERESELKYGY